MRSHGTCPECGHTGILPGVGEAGTTCRSCSGIRLNVDCVECGLEAELYRANRCLGCVLKADAAAVLSDASGTIRPQLQPIVTALGTMERPNSGLTWLQRPRVNELLRALGRGDIELTHEAFDNLPRSKTVDYVRELLLLHGALPPRDRYLEEFRIWSETKIVTVLDAEHVSIMRRFLRWHQNKRLLEKIRTAGAADIGLFLSLKQSTTVSINFLNWLSESGIRLGDMGQADLDKWISSGPSTRHHVITFLYWAMQHRLVRGMELPQRSLANRGGYGHTQRIEGIRRVITDDDLLPNLRIIAGLILIFGQPLNRVLAMRLEQFRDDADGAQLRIVNDWVLIPTPFDTMMRAWIANRMNLQTAAHKNSPWLFPGTFPGKHLAPNYTSGALREVGIPTSLARTAAWRDMVLQGAPTILAAQLGMSENVVQRHAQLAGATFARYAGLAMGPSFKEK